MSSSVAVAEEEAATEEASVVAVSGEEIETEVSEPKPPRPTLVPPRTAPAKVPFSRDALREAIDLVKQMDPVGVGARDLRECLLAQLYDLKRVDRKNGNGNLAAERNRSTMPSCWSTSICTRYRTSTTRKWPRP